LGVVEIGDISLWINVDIGHPIVGHRRAVVPSNLAAQNPKFDRLSDLAIAAPGRHAGRRCQLFSAYDIVAADMILVPEHGRLVFAGKEFPSDKID